LPADLKGVQPGKLPEHLLRPAVGGGKLHWLAAAAWAAMVEKAKADGVELKPVSAGDTYRTYDAQLAAFKQRYTKKPNGNATRMFNGVKWYKKDPKLASLAAPGTSQHNLGIAVDVHTASETKRLKWLIDNVKTFGFSWEVVPEEPWHIRYVSGDDVPAAVRKYMDINEIESPK
jgi:LAS superfamily LD-carboxypeptidase LdcB